MAHSLSDCRGVFALIGRILLIAALLAAVDTHWLVLQSVAWTTMLADNLRHSPLAQAVSNTFDGKHPCSLCKQIAKNSKPGKNTDFQVSLKKLEFAQHTARIILVHPVSFSLAMPEDFPCPSLPHAPPTPPPRGLFI